MNCTCAWEEVFATNDMRAGVIVYRNGKAKQIKAQYESDNFQNYPQARNKGPSRQKAN
jgi:hypothetical protein